MKVFVTGATGFIGTKVVEILLAHGHQVAGLARSDKSADKLTKMGAAVVRGSLDDPASIAVGAKAADGVLHLAFTNNFNDYEGALNKDHAAISAIGDTLAGTHKPFVYTSGTLMAPNLGRTATEKDAAPDVSRGTSEVLALSYVPKGVNTMIVRLSPTVHSAQRQGFGTLLAGMAVNNGKIGLAGNGNNVWPSVARDDAAALFVAALEHGAAGSVYNAVAEEGIPVKDIVKTIADTLGVPNEQFSEAEAKVYYGWFIESVGVDNPTSSAWTQQTLDWHPEGVGLLSDLHDFLADPANVKALKQQN
ncbi:SDR family oxidoreductase [Lacticaseibacillus pabuli]|uniref:SDR family oxidoreductase n=1 Tax=Lacticaseibacillus pabuli TaxID=3025672 RepID=A0ABY7WRE6_9LACO|nr:SDR family oxidoreductase [Lacticaseibacillus sp. KACC 23028]WDF82757.1 SDR family oxidoreductase [Lacticaseibacillus sp. KACC 23028]